MTMSSISSLILFLKPKSRYLSSLGMMAYNGASAHDEST